MYGHNYDTPQSSGISAQNGVHNRGSGGENQPSGRPMPHIDDLKAKAQSRVDPYAPVGFYKSAMLVKLLTYSARYPGYYR